MVRCGFYWNNRACSENAALQPRQASAMKSPIDPPDAIPSSPAVAGRIKGFDGIRTIAVLLVIIAHNFWFKLHLSTGGAGVRLFFVLSGFLIISILARQRETIEAGRTSTRKEGIHFFENRVFRIWPVYFLALAFAVLTVTARKGVGPDPLSWIANAFFFGNVLVANVWYEWRQVGVFWSVGVEEQFYLWAGLALLLSARRWHLAICFCALAVAIIAAVATVALIEDPKRALFSIEVGSLTNFGLIAMGGIASLAMRKNPIVTSAALPCLVVYLLFSMIGWPSWLGHVAGFFLPAVLVMIVLSGIRHDQQSLMVKFLEIAPIRYLGKISYGIYLFHTLIHFEILPVETWFDDHATYKAIAETGLAIGLAALSWHYFEKPILDFRDRRRARHALSEQDPPLVLGRS